MSNHLDPVSFFSENAQDAESVDDAKYWATIAQNSAADAASSATLSKQYADQAAASAAAAANYEFDTTLDWTMTGNWQHEGSLTVRSNSLFLNRANTGGGELLRMRVDNQAAERNLMVVIDNAGADRMRMKLAANGNDYVQVSADDDGGGMQNVLRIRKTGLRQSINGTTFYKVTDAGNDFSPAGQWSFVQPVSGADPVAQQDFVTKEYFESTGGAGFDPSLDQTITGNWTFVPGLTVGGTLSTGVIDSASSVSAASLTIDPAAGSATLNFEDPDAQPFQIQQDNAQLSILDQNAPITALLVWSAGAGTFNGNWSFDAELTVPTPTAAGSAATKGYVDTELSAIDLSAYAALADAETITGLWSFNTSPTVPTPTTNTQASNKAYADARETAANSYTDTEIAAIDFSPYAELAANDSVTGSWTFSTKPVFASGSAATPAWAFTGSGNTGAYFDATKRFVIVDNATEVADFRAGGINFLKSIDTTDARIFMSRDATSTDRPFLRMIDSGVGANELEFRLNSGATEWQMVPRPAGSIATAKRAYYSFTNQDWNFLTNVNGVTFTATSSRELKENIEPLNLRGDILALEPVIYNRKGDKYETPEVGLILEDVAKVYPEICTTQGIEYSRLAVILLKEVQDLKRKIH